MHWGFAVIRCAPLELAPMAGGTDVGFDLDDPRSPLVSLDLPLSVKGIRERMPGVLGCRRLLLSLIRKGIIA